MDIVLVEPEIPQNTGNIARTCALTRSRLHLVKPLGYSLEDRYLKRAGLDYWPLVDVTVWESFDAWEKAFAGRSIYLATTRTERSYHQVRYDMEDVLVFGKETQGLDGRILERYSERLIRIPMLDIGRSLNLSNSAAVVIFEALRQNGFPGLT
jgi:tRNA (cytidine/uridine-2'-O-)-methyltransferase